MSQFKVYLALKPIHQALAAMLFVASGAVSAQSITMASTTSTEQSGLFSHLLPEFKKASGLDVKVVALGTGQALDMAWKECRARGMSTLVLHHERKTGNEESRANRQPSLDNIYGSVWLTSGMDSILHIQGKQGENMVTYTHLKAIINMLDPITAMHDQEHGRTEVVELGSAANAAQAKMEQVYAVIEVNSRGGAVVTAAEVAGKSGISASTVNRHIKKLVDAGRVVEASPYIKASATPATYRVSDGV